MRLTDIYLVLFVLSVVLLSPVNCFGPLAGILAAGGAAVFYSSMFDPLKCQFYECCRNNWVRLNATGLEKALQSRLYGQHLVSETVIRTITGHLRNDEPSKALVLSFHGGTGSGKNYVSQIIAEHLYRNGMKSKYVHIWPATLHFTHKNKLETYKEQLKDWISSNVSACERSLFIFDEMDKLPHGLLDVLKPFLDHHQQIQGVNYRKSIFLLLSNTAGDDIIRKTQEIWQSGKSRSSIKLKEMEELILQPAYNIEGGLWHSSLISSHLISAFIPFLPLTREHVKMCIKDNLRIKKRGDLASQASVVDSIANELQYIPAETQLFSKSGCKRVTEKVDYYLY